ncbi:hypothetical protein F8M41_004164 [Gigaspora margarita]|uniref:Uncharacterized protein n=1 Tax=Gigaspora margarita TaxID=4874 RepID=A0A8H4A7V0_GIGMA|nr:hypothetical protein F8M41_004164 [Gigaspora margarita]
MFLSPASIGSFIICYHNVFWWTAFGLSTLISKIIFASSLLVVGRIVYYLSNEDSGNVGFFNGFKRGLWNENDEKVLFVYELTDRIDKEIKKILNEAYQNIYINKNDAINTQDEAIKKIQDSGIEAIIKKMQDYADNAINVDIEDKINEKIKIIRDKQDEAIKKIQNKASRAVNMQDGETNRESEKTPEDIEERSIVIEEG